MPATASNPGYGGGPQWRASEAALDRARNKRRIGQVMDRLYRGEWATALLDEHRSQWLYPQTRRDDGSIKNLVQRVNLLRLAVDMHADIQSLNPVVLAVPDGFEIQRDRLDAIRRGCMFDSSLHEAFITTSLHAAADFRIDRERDRACIRLEDPERVLGLGELGPDGQPEVFERRWIIEREGRAGEKQERTILRVERHRAPGGAGVIEQEAYEAAGCDVCADLSTITRLSLDEALGAGHGLADSTPTGMDAPLIVRLVNTRHRGAPQTRIPEAEIDVLDASTVALSSAATAFRNHGLPKLRVTQAMIDPNTGAVDLTQDALLDPHKAVEYIQATIDLQAITSFVDRCLEHLTTTLAMTPALLGVKHSGGAAPDTFRKLALEATVTEAAARRSRLYAEPALDRLFTLASRIDSTIGLGGYAVAPVDSRLRPELPISEVDLSDLLGAQILAGVTSRRTAIARLHGEDRAEEEMARIDEERIADSQRQLAALGGAIGVRDPFNDTPAPPAPLAPADPNAPAPVEPESTPTGAAA